MQSHPKESPKPCSDANKEKRVVISKYVKAQYLQLRAAWIEGLCPTTVELKARSGRTGLRLLEGHVSACRKRCCGLIKVPLHTQSQAFYEHSSGVASLIAAVLILCQEGLLGD